MTEPLYVAYRFDRDEWWRWLGYHGLVGSAAGASEYRARLRDEELSIRQAFADMRVWLPSPGLQWLVL